jgi:hypothetical protein
MKKQTAVEWLVEQLKERGYAGEFPPHLLFEQAKQMEKEQHYESYRVGNCFTNSDSLRFEDFFAEYFNETYGGIESQEASDDNMTVEQYFKERAANYMRLKGALDEHKKK